ncbi:DUF3556 domain-containing protein [Streptacidiphilus sp. MAP5-3]|uniref:DUF3556 domain-containing protein n=1 Tax=unclassified Streptacidiphilus TaxID=2643834 RepID=UPI00351916EF
MIPRQTQDYQVHDAALGLLERGQVTVRDMLARQPWPADGPDYPGYDVHTVHLLQPGPTPSGGGAGNATSPLDATS